MFLNDQHFTLLYPFPDSIFGISYLLTSNSDKLTLYDTILHPLLIFLARRLLALWAFFFYQGFLWQTLNTHRTAEAGRDHLLFHCTTSTCLRTFRHLFAILNVRWLSHIFNCTARIYQTATVIYLLPYQNQITISLVYDVMFIFVYLLDDLILNFCYSNLTHETGGLKLALTIILVLQANQLTKCGSH